MGFLKEIGDAQTKHLQAILVIPWLLLPGFHEKLFIENQPLAQINLFAFIAFSTAIGISLFLLNGIPWLALDTIVDPDNPQETFMMDVVSNSTGVTALVSTVIVGVDFVFRLSLTPRAYWLAVGVGSLAFPLVFLYLSLRKRKISILKVIKDLV